MAMVLGDNIFAGHGLKKRLKAAVENAESGKGATVFGYYVDDPERFGIVEFDKDGKAISIEESHVDRSIANPEIFVQMREFPKKYVTNYERLAFSFRG